MYLIDSDILIDYLRLHKPAINFLDGLAEKDRNIALITHFELIKGCQKKLHEFKIGQFLKHFKIIPLSAEVSGKALKIYRTHKWGSNLGIPDAFIAASAVLGKLTLLTRNIKHFKTIPALKVEKPY